MDGIDFDREWDRIRIKKIIDDHVEWLTEEQIPLRTVVAFFVANQFSYAATMLKTCSGYSAEQLAEECDKLARHAEHCREIDGG